MKVAGPPCETWTAARWNTVLDKRGRVIAPVIRTAAYPHGLNSSANRHLDQLYIANTLLHTDLKLTAAMIECRGCSITEHPAEAKWIKKASSIWRTPWVKWRYGSPCAELVHFNQGDHGQIALKPTTLLAVRLPTLRKRLATNYFPEECKGKHIETIIGLSEDGTWKTAPAKEYPPSMNRAIALAIFDAVSSRHRTTHFTEIDDCEDLMHCYASIDSSFEMRPDFFTNTHLLHK